MAKEVTLERLVGSSMAGFAAYYEKQTLLGLRYTLPLFAVAALLAYFMFASDFAITMRYHMS